MSEHVITEEVAKAGKLIEEKKSKEALELIDHIEKEHGKELDFGQRHACSYYRVCAVGYAGDHAAFQKELDAYNQSYRELFRIARGYNHLTKDTFPSYLIEYAEHYISAMDTLWWPISEYAMKMIGGADNVADIFTNRYHTDDADAFKRSHSRQKALEAVREEATDDAGRVRLFKALSASGFLIASLGLLDNKVDKEQVESGLKYLKEAEDLTKTTTIDDLDISRNLFDQGVLYKKLGDEKLAKDHFKRVVELLEKHPLNKDAKDDAESFSGKKLEEMPDPLYLMAKREL